MALGINDLKNGVTIIVDKEVYVIINTEHVKPGKGAAFVRTKLKNIKTQVLLERTFRGDERAEEAFIEQRTLMFLYNQVDFYHFMDQEHFEEITLSADRLASKIKFLKDNMEVTALFHNNEVLNVELPTSVILKVTETEPGLKGDTAKQATKPAILETGLRLEVPLFVNTGESIKVDTRTCEYIERA